MTTKRAYCGTCKRIFYGRKPDDKAPRHQPIDPKTGQKTGEWCHGGGQPLLAREVPAAKPYPCFVCTKPLGVDFVAPGGQEYGIIGPCGSLMDFGLGGFATPVSTSGDNRTLGIICPACMAEGRKRVLAATRIEEKDAP